MVTQAKKSLGLSKITKEQLAKWIFTSSSVDLKTKNKMAAMMDDKRII